MKRRHAAHGFTMSRAVRGMRFTLFKLTYDESMGDKTNTLQILVHYKVTLTTIRGGVNIFDWSITEEDITGQIVLTEV